MKVGVCSTRPSPISGTPEPLALAFKTLYDEALLLASMGLLDRRGNVHCRECRRVVEREYGGLFRCPCGWSLWPL